MFKSDKNKLAYTRRVIHEFERGDYIVEEYGLYKELDSVNTQKDVDNLVMKYSRKPSKYDRLPGEKKLRTKIYTSKLYRDWMDHCRSHHKHKGLLYCIEGYNDNERFIKIGITSTDLYRRLLDFPYKYKVVEAIEFDNMSELYVAEYKLLKKLHNDKYEPKIHPFKGWTECLNIKARRKIQRLLKFKLY